MDLTWTPWAIPGILTLVVAGGAAVVVLRTAPGRSVNRRLACLLALEGLMLASGTGVLFFFESATVAFAVAAFCAAAMAALPWQYLSFLGISLETPLVRPFRSRGAFVAAAVASVAGAMVVLLRPSWFIELYPAGWAPWNFLFSPAGEVATQAYGLVSFFGLAAALSAYSRTRPGTAARTRAKWFAIAFGVRDTYFGSLTLFYPVLRDIPFWGDFVYNPAQGIMHFVYVCLFAYGVLTTQLFDIQLRIKFALQQGAIGGIIAGAFFVGSELLEAVVPVEGTVLGLLAAGVIVVALRPVRRFAETFASQVMPGVEDTPAYIGAQKLRVYRAALEGAVEDGAISRKERDILSRLREQLGIGAGDAERAERDVLGRAPVAVDGW